MVFYADHPDFQQTNVIGGFIDQGTGGVTEALRDAWSCRSPACTRTNDHVLGHEMVHVFQYDIAERHQRAAGINGLNQLPLWLIEGMAEYLSVGRQDRTPRCGCGTPRSATICRSIKQLTTDPRYFPYRYGQALWAYIGGKWGDQTVSDVYRASLRGGWDAALRRVIGISSDSLSKEWLSSIRDAYMPLMQGRMRPDSVGQTLIGNRNERGEHERRARTEPRRQMGRVLRPSRPVHRGPVRRRRRDRAQSSRSSRDLTRDPHFDALSFISASGSWSPDGRKLAFVSFAEGDNEIAIFDVNSRNESSAASGTRRRCDQRRGVGSGRKHDRLQRHRWRHQRSVPRRHARPERLQQLTNDRYADLQPAWSPDGKIARVRDRRGPGTDFERIDATRRCDSR